MTTPILERPFQGGEQKIYRFSNGYGASVVRHSFSYGAEEGLWELAVVTFDEKDNWHLTYETPITDDVIGHLTWKEVETLLADIEDL